MANGDLSAKWWEPDWSKADQVHQDGLDLAKEEAAEAKLAEHEREQLEVAREQALMDAEMAKAAERMSLMTFARNGALRAPCASLAKGAGASLTVGGNPLMQGRILGRFPPAMSYSVNEDRMVDQRGSLATREQIENGDVLLVPAKEQRQVIQLLRDKQAQIDQRSQHIENLLRELHGRTASADENADLLARKDHAWRRQQVVINLMEPIIRVRCEETSEHVEWEACKAALEAYKELGNDIRPAEGGPRPMGEPPVRHSADCQGERPAGMAGGELSGPAQGEDRVASSVRASDVRQDTNGYRYTKRYVGPGNPISPGVVLFMDSKGLYSREYLR